MFEVDGEMYHVAPGTIRNKFSKFKKSGEIELECNSKPAFYTLKGNRFGKTMTVNHTGVNSNKMDLFVRFIQNLPMDKNALHNIQWKFVVKGIWKFLSTYHTDLHTNEVSKDILIPTYNFGDILVRVIVHKTDTVSISMACSLAPFYADLSGIISICETLARVEERIIVLLSRDNRTHCDLIVNVACTENISHLRIPEHKTWFVTMWHNGADSLTEYSGDMSHITWKDAQNALIRVYPKVMKDKKKRIRLERQEYPRKTWQEVVEEKIGLGER